MTSRVARESGSGRGRRPMTRVVADRRGCGGWWVDAPGCSPLRHHFSTRREAEACAREWLSDLGQPDGEVIVLDLYQRVVHDAPTCGPGGPASHERPGRGS